MLLLELFKSRGLVDKKAEQDRILVMANLIPVHVVVNQVVWCQTFDNQHLLFVFLQLPLGPSECVVV